MNHIYLFVCKLQYEQSRTGENKNKSNRCQFLLNLFNSLEKKIQFQKGKWAISIVQFLVFLFIPRNIDGLCAWKNITSTNTIFNLLILNWFNGFVRVSLEFTVFSSNELSLKMSKTPIYPLNAKSFDDWCEKICQPNEVQITVSGPHTKI